MEDIPVRPSPPVNIDFSFGVPGSHAKCHLWITWFAERSNEAPFVFSIYTLKQITKDFLHTKKIISSERYYRYGMEILSDF